MSFQSLVGQKLGQYELRELLGVGGMGAVYRAYHPALQKEVAVKILSSAIASDPGAIERFIREARTTAALDHIHIVPLFDFGTQQEVIYVVMRLLTGGSLAQRLEQRLPSLGETADLLKQLASALDYAHSRGVIHRDLKPSNVMFDNQGNAFLVDFGIAKLSGSTSILTGSGVAMGTPTYMAPEQWRGEELTPAADLYALGEIAYTMLTGHVPFEAPTPYALMSKHINDMPTPVQTYRADVPGAVTQVLERAMAKRPEERFPTATAFAQAFAAAVAGVEGSKTNFTGFKLPPRPVSVSATPGSAPRPLTPSQPSQPGQPQTGATASAALRNPVILGAAALIVLLVVGALALLSSGGGDSVEQRANATLTEIAQQTRIAQQVAQQMGITPSATPIATDTASPLVILATFTPGPTDTLLPDDRITETPPSATPAPAIVILPTETPTSAPTVTLIPSETFTLTPSPTPTETLTPTATETATVTATASVTASRTPTETPTPTASATPTETPTPTASATASAAPTGTFTPAPTVTAGLPMATFIQGVNVRSGPSTLFNPPIGSFAAGASVEILAVSPDGQWFKVPYFQGEGWIFAALVTITGDISVLPVDPGPPVPTLTPLPTLPPMQPAVLWLSDCDPRTDANVCSISTSLDIFNEFYGLIEDLGGTLVYDLPAEEAALYEYDVVIADFCQFGLTQHPDAVDWLTRYIQAGGSVIALGDTFCVGSGEAATRLTEPFGIVFTDDDVFDENWSDPPAPHALTSGVTRVYALRHAYLEVRAPAQTIITFDQQPFLAVYADAGTLVAIPSVGFAWGRTFGEVADSDNFVLWSNLFSWLTQQARARRQAPPTPPTAAATLTPCQVADLNGSGAVDVLDTRIISRYLGSQTGDDLYDPAYDLNQDGRIDVLDLRRVSGQYGQTCP